VGSLLSRSELGNEEVCGWGKGIGEIKSEVFGLFPSLCRAMERGLASWAGSGTGKAGKQSGIFYHSPKLNRYDAAETSASTHHPKHGGKSCSLGTTSASDCPIFFFFLAVNFWIPEFNRSLAGGHKPGG